jgi:recombination protein RecA
MPRGIKGSGKAAVAAAAKATGVDTAPAPAQTRRTQSATATSTVRKGGDKLAQIDAIANKIFSGAAPVVDIDTESLKKSMPHIPTGSVILDYLIGGRPNKNGISPCPGWPKGMISNIYGHESSGKTTVALTAAADVCRRGGQVIFIDWEHAIAPDYAMALGVPVTDKSKFRLYQPNTLEEGLKILALAIKAGVDLVILDSVGAGVPEAVFGQAVEEIGDLGRLGLVASKWSLYLPKFASLAAKSGTHVMGLSQLRSKIQTGGYGGSDSQHQGGKAWLFYSAVRMSFRRVKSIKTKGYDAVAHKQVERATSALILAKMDKCKVAGTQQNEQTFYIVFGQGIDDTHSIIDIATNHGIIKKGGAWFTWERGNGDSVRGQGYEDFVANLLRNPGGLAQLKDLVFQAMAGAGAKALNTTAFEEAEVEMDAASLDDILSSEVDTDPDLDLDTDESDVEVEELLADEEE